METVETVKIKAPVTKGNDAGYVVINKADLTDAHELFEPAEAVKADAPETTDEPAADKPKRPYTRRQ